MKVAILTDTNSGISAKEAEEMGVFVMPMPVIIDEEVFFEGVNITEEEFFAALTGGKNVSTSQPSPSDVMDMWDGLLAKGYDQIVYIPMSSGLSSSCMSARGYALDYEDKVFVADNHRISVTMHQSVVDAKRFADAGMSGREIWERLEKDAYNATIYLAVNTLEFLKKGGRVTPAAAAIGTVLNIKPILSIQGEKLDSFAKVRGQMKKCQEKMIEALKKDMEVRFGNPEPSKMHVGAACAGCSEEEQEEWVAMLTEAFPGSDIYNNPLSASISTHTGPGAVGVGISVDVD